MPSLAHLPSALLDICSWVLDQEMPCSSLGTCQHLLCVPVGMQAGCRALVRALGWVEVVVVVVVMMLMVVMVFMPLDHRHCVALRPQHRRQVPHHLMLYHGRLAVPLEW